MSEPRHEKYTCWGDDDEKGVPWLLVIVWYWFISRWVGRKWVGGG